MNFWVVSSHIFKVPFKKFNHVQYNTASGKMEPRPTPYNGPGFSMTKESLVAMGLTEEQATNTVKGADVRFLDVPFYAHLSNNFSMISWCVGYFAGTPLEEYSVVTPFWVTVIFDPGFMLTSGDRNSFTPWVITATLPVVVVVSSVLKDSLQG